MEVIAPCPACADAMVFRHRSRERGARLIADCVPCTTSYTLWGGRMVAVPSGGGEPHAEADANRSMA